MAFDAKHRCACGKMVTARAAAAARAMRRCRCHAHNALRPQLPPEPAEPGTRAAAECGPCTGDTTPGTPVPTTAAGTVAGAVEPRAQGGRPIGGADLAPSTTPVAAAARLEAAAPPPVAATEAWTEVVMGSEEARLRGFRPDEEVLMPLHVWSDSDED